MKTPKEEKWIEELRQNRLNEQSHNNDYSYKQNGSIEKCDDCGSLINSHGHCPTCDY